jgi:arylsulfatase
MRKWKADSFEGGVATPLVAHWPAGIKPQSGWNRDPVHLIDLMPTVLALTGARYPGESKQTKIPPMDGVSLLPAFQGQTIVRTSPLFFQFAKGAAVLDGRWKLVRNSPTWELYDLAADRTETRDLAAQRAELVRQLDAAWLAWWKDCTGSDWTGKAPKEVKDE